MGIRVEDKCFMKRSINALGFKLPVLDDPLVTDRTRGFFLPLIRK
jgi:hypothetical protein